MAVDGVVTGLSTSQSPQCSFSLTYALDPKAMESPMMTPMMIAGSRLKKLSYNKPKHYSHDDAHGYVKQFDVDLSLPGRFRNEWISWTPSFHISVHKNATGSSFHQDTCQPVQPGIPTWTLC